MSLSNNFKPLAQGLALPSVRARIHFGLMLCGIGVLLAVPPQLHLLPQQMAEDKAMHYAGGQIIGTSCFYAGYLLLAIRMLLMGKGPVVLRLLWLPTAYVVMGGLVLIIVSLVAGGKEVLDSTGIGTVDWEDFTATLDGAWAPHIDGAITLLGLTPALIPLDMFLQWPEKLLRSTSTGKKDVDEYLQEKKAHNEKNVSVLLVEDDLACAALALKFCKKVKLHCHHVDTIAAAVKAFQTHQSTLKVLILDLFVRVEDANDRRTGAEWLEELQREFPKDQRSFSIIITTGHVEQLGERAPLADMILAKPWSPADLLAFLQQKKIITTA
jgi:CheY-like chemotaxis protein